jgi:7-carboxy-7-deazaguanine synthase
MSSHMLAVNEIFGPTFQGEGPTMGTPCIFLRLAGCNLACSWCDTPFSWDWTRYDKTQEVHLLDIATVEARIRALSHETMKSGARIGHLVISGGEPMLQGERLIPLIDKLVEQGWTSEIETAGTIAPKPSLKVGRYNVSPKLQNSGNSHLNRYKPDVLDAFNQHPQRCFKFVVQDVSDFDEIDALVQKHNLGPVYIMPEGIEAAQVQKTLTDVAEAAIVRNYHVTTRLHTLTYGNRRAV